MHCSFSKNIPSAAREPCLIEELPFAADGRGGTQIRTENPNTKDTKDRLRGELDFDVNRRAEAEIQGLARKLNLLGDKLDDIDEKLSRR